MKRKFNFRDFQAKSSKISVYRDRRPSACGGGGEDYIMIACPGPMAASIRLRRHRAEVAATVTVSDSHGGTRTWMPALIHARGRRSRSDLDSEPKRLILLHRGPGLISG